jgi:polar amino acid transport system substrate-binding protein
MFGLVLALLLAAPSAELRVGMDTRSRPWVFVPGLDYLEEDFTQPPKITPAQIDQLVGVDIDILQAIAKRMGVTVRIVPVAWEDIETGLIEKRYDAIMNAWVPSSKTPKEIANTPPYYDWGLLVNVRADDLSSKSFADLAGKTVGHFRDPSVDRSVLSLRAGRLVPFDDSDQLFEALRDGKLDAAVEDSTYSRWRVAGDKAFRIVGDPLNRIGYHVGVRRADTELLNRIGQAIFELRSSPEMSAIRKKWESAAAPR